MFKIKHIATFTFILQSSLSSGSWAQYPPINTLDLNGYPLESSEILPSSIIEKQDISLTGNIFKSNDGEFVTFDVIMGDPNLNYTVKGSTSTSSGIYQSPMDYSPVKVRKEINSEDGRIFRKEFPNRGSLMIYPRERRASEGLILAGIPISGSFLQGYVNDGIWFDDLVVDGVQSKGYINYTSYDGHYTPKDKCTFGTCVISSSSNGPIFNYDNNRLLTAKNRYLISLNFGDLQVTGTINFADVTSRKSEETVVKATSGSTSLTIRRIDGSPLKLSTAIQQETSDEKNLRLLIAYLQLITFDTFAE